ncbi:MAG: diaminopimelate decarboxylase [Bdellovibrionota bacterium]
MKMLKRPQLPKDLPQTPFYFYDEAILKELSEGFRASVDSSDEIILHYAVKANSHPAILKFLHKYGSGLDVVSGAELRLALECGYYGDRIVFSGVGKTQEEMKLAIENEIGMLIVESCEEFEELCEVSKAYPSKTVKVGFRFNPNLSVETHPYIATGLWEHKFGMAGEEVLRMMELSIPANVKLQGISLHLGSQIFDDKIFYDAVNEVVKLAKIIQSKYKKSFPVLNVGGGLGVDYQEPYKKPGFENYGKFLKWALAEWKQLNPDLKCQVYSECGRALVAQSGYLVTKVIRVKSNPKKNFAIVDASMTELIRPALYSAYHAVEKLEPSGLDEKIYDIVGPVCESGDFLAEKRSIEELKRGDLLWVLCAGAYGYVMSSHYNLRPLPAEYFLESNGVLRELHGPLQTWNIK